MSKTRSRRTRKPKHRNSTPLILLSAGVVLIIVGLVALAFSNDRGRAEAASNSTRWETAPTFVLPTLQGERLALADYQGQYVLVNFWATWCPPCRAELPDLVSYYEAHADQGFMLIGVNERESPSLINSFLDSSALDFPVVMDSDGRVMQQYGVSAMPSSFLVNPQGQIVQMWSGMISRATLEGTITPLLEAQS